MAGLACRQFEHARNRRRGDYTGSRAETATARRLNNAFPVVGANSGGVVEYPARNGVVRAKPMTEKEIEVTDALVSLFAI